MTIHSHDRATLEAGGDGEPADAAPHDPQVYFNRALEVLERAGALTTTKVWTPGRQAAFLALIGEGATVAEAARSVGVVERTAYSFRRRVAGTSFDIGWRAAKLLARDKLQEELYARCLKGQNTTIETTDDTPDGERTRFVTRHSHDNRLGMAMLARLDRLAEDSNTPGAYAARLVAMDYDSYLARVATGAAIEPFIRQLARQVDEVEKMDLTAPLPEEEEDDDDFD